MLSKTDAKYATAVPNATQSNLHGASLVDKNGRETPITEEMIQSAFQYYIKAWESHQKKHHR